MIYSFVKVLRIYEAKAYRPIRKSRLCKLFQPFVGYIVNEMHIL